MLSENVVKSEFGQFVMIVWNETKFGTQCYKMDLDWTLVNISRWLFPSHKAAGGVAKIGSSLKPKHQKQVKLVKIAYMHCTWKKLSLYKKQN